MLQVSERTVTRYATRIKNKGLMASFRIDLNGELIVSVFGEKLEATPVPAPQYNVKKEPSFKLQDKELYLNMAYLVSNLNGAVWDSKVSGKPVKYKKSG